MDAFKHVGKAYATLSDERKRRNYDQFGESAAGGMGDINLDEIFRQAFGNQDIGQIFA
jgi:curved DNA-binding protein